VRLFKKKKEEKKIIDEKNELLLGKILSNQQFAITSSNLNDFEFKIFSQFGDDGIIQYLIKNIDISNKTFIEFGVENYLESNTRFLLMNNNWSGFVMDGSTQAMEELQNQDWYWKYDLTQKAIFIDKDNINKLLSDTGLRDIGLLCIDLDGNDYWIFEEIDLLTLNPSILMMEYNALLGKDRAISVPYDKNFHRFDAHYSGLYWGASLSALAYLADKKGYSLIGCNSAGNNAYFVRKDLLNLKITDKSVNECYIESKFRESRDKNGELSFLRKDERSEAIKGLDVVNIISGSFEKL